MNKKPHWGIDIGGTTTVIGYLSKAGFIKTSVLDTDTSSSPRRILRRIADSIMSSGASPESVGAGIAGLVDRKRGLLVSSPNLPNWKDYPLRKKLAELLECKVVIDNDCNVFAVQAMESGVIPRSGLWIMITVGTGIGGTIISSGEILYGRGYAGEVGHMTVDAQGRECPCGSTGCWERYAASEALKDCYHGYSGDETELTPKQIAEKARSGNDPAKRAFQELGRWLGVGLASLCHCLDPDGVFMAGGLMGASSLFLDSAKAEFRRRCSYPWMVRVLPSSISEAGAEGAALMGRNELE